MCKRPSELPANRVGPPCTTPWRLDKAEIVPWLPFVSHSPPRLGLLACHSPPFHWPGWRSTPGLLTHLRRNASKVLGKEAHLRLCHPFWGIRVRSSPSPISKATAH